MGETLYTDGGYCGAETAKNARPLGLVTFAFERTSTDHKWIRTTNGKVKFTVCCGKGATGK